MSDPIDRMLKAQKAMFAAEKAAAAGRPGADERARKAREAYDRASAAAAKSGW